jgi:predicted small lipoprotein YifL
MVNALRVWFAAVFVLAACGKAPPHAFPDSARDEVAQSCPRGNALCDCQWERITRSMTPEEFSEARARLLKDGLSDPRFARARLECLEKLG